MFGFPKVTCLDQSGQRVRGRTPVWQRASQGSANIAYRSLARLGAKALGTSPIVQSVLLHRSVAAGEVSFARSDIDLMVIIRKPRGPDLDAAELWKLCLKNSRLRSCLPVFGHVEVHDPDGLEEWDRADTYWASIRRHTSQRLYGIPIEASPTAIRRVHAVLRFCLLPHYFLSAAVLGRNRRNLRKIALDMWNACMTAMGRIAEPFPTRRETEEFLLASDDGFSAARLRDDAGYALQFILHTSQQLHAHLLPPLRAAEEPVIFEARLPPSFHLVKFVVLPGSRPNLSPVALAENSVVTNAELLDLYIHYANCFAYEILPRDLIRRGFERPGLESAIRTCRYEFHSYWLRAPGFINEHSGRPYARMYAFGNTLDRLESGDTASRFDPSYVKRYQEMRPSVADYYQFHYARLLEQQERLWERLVAVSGPGA